MLVATEASLRNGLCRLLSSSHFSLSTVRVQGCKGLKPSHSIPDISRVIFRQQRKKIYSIGTWALAHYQSRQLEPTNSHWTWLELHPAIWLLIPRAQAKASKAGGRRLTRHVTRSFQLQPPCNAHPRGWKAYPKTNRQTNGMEHGDMAKVNEANIVGALKGRFLDSSVPWLNPDMQLFSGHFFVSFVRPLETLPFTSLNCFIRTSHLIQTPDLDPTGWQNTFILWMVDKKNSRLRIIPNIYHWWL